MATSKAPLFPKPIFHQSFWSKALAHPARIIILTYLLEHGKTPFYDLVKEIPLAKTTISQHLRTLRQTGLIEIEERYPHSYYTLRFDLCQDLAKSIQPLHQIFLHKPV